MDNELFWEKQHLESNIFWLTGSSAEAIVKLHKVEDFPCDVVLDLGIGYGQVIDYFQGKKKVIAVDISLFALNRVLDKATCYLTKELEDLPSDCVDLATCHLVFQHCDDESVKFILKNIYRALSKNGLFSFQVATIENKDELDDFHKKGILDGTHYMRTKKEYEEFISECSDCAFEYVNVEHHGNIDWWIVHLRKKNVYSCNEC